VNEPEVQPREVEPISASRKVELLISDVLRVGVAVSLSLVVIGTVVSFLHHPDYVTSQEQLKRLTSPGAAFPRTPAQVIGGLKHGRGQAIVVIGLVLLIATPVVRVAVSIAGFIYERDWAFVVITTIVLFLLILSFVLGKVEG
jgi:uncharacterized membrane protein